MTDLHTEPPEVPKTAKERLARMAELAKERASMFIDPVRRCLANETEDERWARMMESNDPAIWDKYGEDGEINERMEP